MLMQREVQFSVEYLEWNWKNCIGSLIDLNGENFIYSVKYSFSKNHTDFNLLVLKSTFNDVYTQAIKF